MSHSSYRQWKEIKKPFTICPIDMEWRWDPSEATSEVKITNDSFDIHPKGSKGTGAVRGDTPFIHGQMYYWEIEICNSRSTLDMMVGVGTKDFDLKSFQYEYCSLIGSDKKSWGYSLRGVKHHDGEISAYGVKNGNERTLIGVRLDMWRGTLEYFYNRKPLGVAFENLNKENILYPMVCFTSCQSKFKIKYCQSLMVNLQLLCLEVLDSSNDKFMPPGLLKKVKDSWWIPRYSPS